MSTRREFLFDCSTALAALALAPVGWPALAADDFQSVGQMSYPALAAQVNTPFRVRLSPRRVVELTLLKAPLAPPTPARPGRLPPGDAGNEKFSLIFSGPKEVLLDAAIHRFAHAQLGQFEMSIGQIGAQDAQSIRYEAVFNRAATAAAPRANPT